MDRLKLNKLKKRIGIRLIGIALVLLGIAGVMLLIVRPNVIKICSYNSKNVAQRLINNAINRRIDSFSEDLSYNFLIRLTYTEGGHVSSIETNTTLINRLKSELLLDLNDNINTEFKDSFSVSAGTLSGIPVFHGVGPEVRVIIEPRGYADGVFISQFTDAGLNQTLHRIIMRTKLNITVFIPLYSFDIDVTEDYLICETVIVGDVPESYTHVVSEDKDIIDSINDFEAEPYD